jgi:pimeloyl-ACP methyl ester carboxylesterase
MSVPYVDVAGMRVWHEVLGEPGEGTAPVVLLHGGMASASSWSGQAPGLAGAGYQVYLPERRGHGHTPDQPGPITYSLMAGDTIAYLDQVAARPAHLIGWSDGAVVALLAAQRRPDLAASLVLIGQYFNSAGRVQGGLTDLLVNGDEQVTGFLRESYSKESPDGPGHFDEIYGKVTQMWRTEPEIDLATLANVGMPAMVLQGDRDEVKLGHSAAVAAALGDGRLAVLPGTHLLPIESPELVTSLLVAAIRGWPPSLV